MSAKPIATALTNEATQHRELASRGNERYNKEDVYWLEKIVMAEAEGEPYEGKIAVANVILNRVRSGCFPNTIKDVIFQKGQFEPVENGRLESVLPNEETINAVNEALNGRKEIDEDVYYFCNPKLATSRWMMKNLRQVKIIGNHSFFK